VVEIRHGSGVYVRDPAAVGGDAVDYAKFRPSTEALFEARVAVEPGIAELCTLRMDRPALAELGSSISLARAAIRSKAPYPEFAALQLKFHLQLAAHCDSPVLRDIADRLVSVDEHPLWALINQHAVRTRTQRLAQVAEHAAVFTESRLATPPAPP